MDSVRITVIYLVLFAVCVTSLPQGTIPSYHQGRVQRDRVKFLSGVMWP